MSKLAALALAFLAFTPALSSKTKNKDKDPTVPFHQMALEMNDAFSCGVVVEKYLHGNLKGNEEGYKKERERYNCDHVESILNTLGDQQTPPSK